MAKTMSSCTSIASKNKEGETLDQSGFWSSDDVKKYFADNIDTLALIDDLGSLIDN